MTVDVGQDEAEEGDIPLDVIDIPITFDGGAGSDMLLVAGTPETSVHEVVYTPGADVASGRLVYEDDDASALMRIDFVNLEPVIDLVTAPKLTVNGTNGDNAINYARGANTGDDLVGGAVTGLVSVDGFETIEFANKAKLVIDGLAGSDEINLRDPHTPTGLTSIAVKGGDPTASDRLIVNGKKRDDEFTFEFDAKGGTMTTEDLPEVSFAGVESVFLNGRGGADTINIAGTRNTDRFTFTPGATVDSGTIRASSSGVDSVPLSFDGIGELGSVMVYGARSSGDTLVYNGTSSDDAVTVTASGSVLLSDLAGDRVEVGTDRVEYLALDGLAGDDTFDINGEHPYLALWVSGGDPSTGDVLNLLAPRSPSAAVIRPSTWNPMDQVVEMGDSAAYVGGIELITYTGRRWNDTLEVNAGAGDHSIRVQYGPSRMDLVTADTLPDILFADLETFQVRPRAGSDQVTFVTGRLSGAQNYVLIGRHLDTLVIEGSDGAADSFVVNNAGDGGYVSVTDELSGVTVTDVGSEGDHVGRLQINTLGSDDTVTVDVDGALLSDVIDVPITFDGGAGSDTLMVVGTPPTEVDGVVYTPGPDVASGRLVYEDEEALPLMTIDFAHLDPVIDLVTAATLTVNGTNGDNAISYARGPNTGEDLVGAAVTGLVSVDGFETVEFANKTRLVIDGLAGSDEINLRYRNTPTGLARIAVKGGDPTSSDAVVVNGTTGADTIGFAPTEAGSAIITGVLGVTRVTVSTAERLLIDGRGGDDSLTVAGTTSDDTILHRVGDAVDSGSIAVNELLPLDYTNLGAAGVLSVIGRGGDDLLEYVGTRFNDIFTVGNTGTIDLRTVALLGVNEHVDVVPTGVERLVLDGLDGDDRFALSTPQPYTRLILAGGSGQDDLIEITDAPGSDDPFEVFPGVVPGEGTVTVGGTPFNYVGIGHVHLFASAAMGDDDDLTIHDDTGDNMWTVAGGSLLSGTSVQIDNREPVEFTGFNDLTLQNGPMGPTGIDRVRMYLPTSGLGLNGGLAVSGTGGDVLEAVGNGMDNVVTVVPGGGAQGTVTIDGTAVEFGGLAQLDLIGAEGRDRFDVTPLGDVDISVGGDDPIGVMQIAGDRLNVSANGAAFAFAPGPDGDDGTIAVAGTGYVSFDDIEKLQIDDIEHLLPDDLESNDTTVEATVLGSIPWITLTDLTLHASQMPFGGNAGVANEDRFALTAHDTGLLAVNAFFTDDGVSKDGDEGNVNIQIWSAAGNLTPAGQGNSTTDNEQIVVPVVSGEVYYLRVLSADGDPNYYSLEIENFAAPVPNAVVLLAADNTGASNSDDVTSKATARVAVEADLIGLAGQGIRILTPDEAEAGNTRGAAVQVFVNGVSVGFARQIAQTYGDGYILAFSEGDLREGQNSVTAAVRMIDGTASGVKARTQLSEPLVLTLDTTAPASGGISVRLAPSSDTGVDSTDHVTSQDEPAFVGTGEPNAKVRVLANGIVVGQGIVGTDGDWEVTVEPLADGAYDVTVEAEDLAGNTTLHDPSMTIWIDTRAPNTPYLDLISDDDNGLSDTDNVTSLTDLRVTVTADDTIAGAGNPFPNDVTYRIYDRPGDANSDGEVLIVDSFASLADLTSGGFFLEQLPTLSEGAHNLKLEVEDRAGNISSDFLLPVTIDPSAWDVSSGRLANGQVILYDTDAIITGDTEAAVSGADPSDVDASDVLISVDAFGVVTGVAIVGNPTGLGMLVRPIGGEPVRIIDARNLPSTSVEPLSFIATSAPVTLMYLTSPVSGWDIGQILVDEGVLGTLDVDGDGDETDLTAIYAGADPNTPARVEVRGGVGGDVVIGDASYLRIHGDAEGDVKVQGSVGGLSVFGGLNGYASVLGDAEAIVVEGDITEDVTVDGLLARFVVTGTQFTGTLTAGAIGHAQYGTANGVEGKIETKGLDGDPTTSDGYLNRLDVMHGPIAAPVVVGGDANQINAHHGSTVGGAIDVAGDLGRQYVNGRNGHRRLVTEGLWSGGNLGGSLTVDGTVWKIAVDGEIQGVVEIGGDAAIIAASNGVSAAITVGKSAEGGGPGGSLSSFVSGGDVSGALTVYGDAGTLTFGTATSGAGQVQAAVDIRGNVDRLSAYHGTSGAGTVHVTGDVGVIESYELIQGAIDVGGNVDRIDAHEGTSASGTIGLGGNLGRQYRNGRNGHRRLVTEGLWSGGNVGGSLTVGGMAWIIAVDGEIQGVVVIGGDAEIITTANGVSATGAIHVTGDAGLIESNGLIQGGIDVGGNVDRIDAYEGTSASGTIDVAGELGREYLIRRRGRRRLVTEGFWCGENLGGGLTVGGVAWKIAVDGEIQGVVEIGGDAESITAANGVSAAITVGKSAEAGGPGASLSSFTSGGDVSGALTVYGNANSLTFGSAVSDAGEVQAAIDIRGNVERLSAHHGTSAAGTLHVTGDVGLIESYGLIEAGIDIDGNVDRIDAHEGTSASGTIDVAGELGREYLIRRRGRRRLVTEGLSCGGDLGGNLTVGGTTWTIDVTGHVLGAVRVGTSAETGGLGGDLGSFHSTGNVSAGVTVYGNVEHLLCEGRIESAVSVDGDLTRMDAHGGTSAEGTIDVTGDLGRLYSYRRRGRRRWATEGFWSGGDTRGTITVGGTAWHIDVRGDFAEASVTADTLYRVTVDGRITSTIPQVIRSLLAGSTFYVSDATWSGTITAGSPHVFDGAVTARIGA